MLLTPALLKCNASQSVWPTQLYRTCPYRFKVSDLHLSPLQPKDTVFRQRTPTEQTLPLSAAWRQHRCYPHSERPQPFRIKPQIHWERQQEWSKEKGECRASDSAGSSGADACTLIWSHWWTPEEKWEWWKKWQPTISQLEDTPLKLVETPTVLVLSWKGKLFSKTKTVWD